VSCFMRSAQARFDTFHYGVRKRLIAFAEAGFYVDTPQQGANRKNYNDEVTCAFCGVSIASWEANDDPGRVHKELSKKCPMVLGKHVGNQPMERDPYLAESHLASFFVDIKRSIVKSLPNEEKGTIQRKNPLHSKYRTVQARIESFKGCWIKEGTVTAEALADAGFFYDKKRDHVYCFQCACGFGGWIKGANPMTLHAHYAPTCNYVRVSRPWSPPIAVEDPLFDLKACKVCCIEEMSGVFLPCGHMVTCWKCSQCVSDCPLCRTPVTYDVPVFMA
jgi:baculoviral IAP repeat-containing protein 7/8